jgi:hypothetical protein
MEPRDGWFERSLERAQKNIEARPERLKPERYRQKKAAATATKKKPAAAN